MTNIILSGANGRMGHVIADIVSKDEQEKIVCGLDINTERYADFDIVTDLNAFGGRGDVIIDFSHPLMLTKVLDYAVTSGTPAVIATTGLSDEQICRITDAAKSVPIFFSANMSLGVNLLIELSTRVARVLDGNFDIEIVERHHNQKIDAPSGTALAIANAISDSLPSPKEFTYDRHSARKKRGKNEIGIHAVRGGTIVGDHDVIFAGLDEIIELRHSAASKDVFATGALKAAAFLTGKPAGLYNMKDLVGGLIV